MIFFATCIAAITAIVLWGRRNGGSYHVDKSSDALAFRYVPAATGTVAVIWWRNIVSSYIRMHPYILMAAQQTASNEPGSKSRKSRRTLKTSYDVLFEPNLFDIKALASNGHWLLSANNFVYNIVGFFIVGLKAAFIQTTPTGNGWNIGVSNRIGYTLIAIYSLLITTTMAILIRLYNRGTGLKWDPVSIADELALLQHPDFRALFANLETYPYAEYRAIMKTRASEYGVLRLGYWKNRLDGEIWHGIAFAPKVEQGLLHATRSFIHHTAEIQYTNSFKKKVRTDKVQAQHKTASQSHCSRDGTIDPQRSSDTSSKEREQATPQTHTYPPSGKSPQPFFERTACSYCEQNSR